MIDTEAIAWAYSKLNAFGVGNGNMNSAMMMDRLNGMLAAAPTPPAQEIEPVGYIHRPHGLVYAWQFSDELPVPNWIKVHQVWQFVYVRPPEGDKLRKAADEVIDRFYNAKCDGELEESVINLRASLEGE